MTNNQKTVGLIVTAAILVVAVLVSGTLCAVNLIKNTSELDESGVVYIEDFPVLKQSVEFAVFDKEEFPAQTYQITVERFLLGGILKNISFRKTIISETSTEPVYEINFEKDGTYRITLKDITASRTQSVTENNSSETTDDKIIIVDVIVDNNNSEATDNAGIATTPSDSAEVPAMKPDISTENYLEATDKDLKNFENLFSALLAHDGTYDSNSQDAGRSAVTALTATFSGTYYKCAQIYNFPEVTVLDAFDGDPRDPRNLFNYEFNGEYFKFSGDTIDWIVRNIYNTEPSATEYFNSPSFCNWYYQDGYYYSPLEIGGAGDFWSVSVKNTNRTSDGKYTITAYVEVEDYGIKEVLGDYQVTAALRDIDGKRVWTFEKWGKANSQNTLPAEQSTQQTSTEPNTEKVSPSPSAPQNNFTGVQRTYSDHVNSNKSVYCSYESYTTTAEPEYTFIDLDQDGTQEAIVTAKYYNTDAYISDFVIVHILGIKDGKVVCVFTSELAAAPRMTEKIRIFKDIDGNIYIHRYWRDGRNSQREVVYTYSNGNIVVEYGLYGDYNMRPKVFEKGNGKDPFASAVEGYSPITEEEFAKYQDNLENRGTTYYFSSDFVA